MEVLRTQQYIIKKGHRLYQYCDDVCFKSKNLYNYANYLIKQEFINNGRTISAFDLNKKLKTHETFQALPAKTSQQIIIQLGRNWKSFFKAVKDWSNNKYKYCGKPALPKYKKKDGRNIVFFDYMQSRFKNGHFYFQSRERGDITNYIQTSITQEEFRLLRIIPYGSCYKIDIVYRKEIQLIAITNDNYLAIDLGINNLATLTNNIGLQPIVINGKVLKSRNNYYNKMLSKARSYVGKKTSKRIKRLNIKHANIINTMMHKTSRWIINYCLENNILNIIIGFNKDWQRGSRLGRKNNQMFHQIPFAKLIEQIQYKSEEVGINVILVDEKYTSKASFIDDDIIPDKFGDYIFSGKRIKRGLYQSKDGTLINADVNGSYNILRKCNPEFKYDDRIKGVSLHPIRLNVA